MHAVAVRVCTFYAFSINCISECVRKRVSEYTRYVVLWMRRCRADVCGVQKDKFSFNFIVYKIEFIFYILCFAFILVFLSLIPIFSYIFVMHEGVVFYAATRRLVGKGRGNRRAYWIPLQRVMLSICSFTRNTHSNVSHAIHSFFFRKCDTDIQLLEFWGYCTLCCGSSQ